MNIKRETKSRKVTLGFKPSVYTPFQQIAYVQNTSVNGLLSDFMEQYVAEHQAELQEYSKLVPKQQ